MFPEGSLSTKGVIGKMIDSLTEIRKSCKTHNHDPAG